MLTRTIENKIKLALIASLGSFLSALTAANEPRIKNVCMILGGGGLVVPAGGISLPNQGIRPHHLCGG